MRQQHSFSATIPQSLHCITWWNASDPPVNPSELHKCPAPPSEHLYASFTSVSSVTVFVIDFLTSLPAKSHLSVQVVQALKKVFLVCQYLIWHASDYTQKYFQIKVIRQTVIYLFVGFEQMDTDHTWLCLLFNIRKLQHARRIFESSENN